MTPGQDPPTNARGERKGPPTEPKGAAGGKGPTSFARELRLTRWAVAARASQRSLNRNGLLVLVAASVVTAGLVVCLALDVGEGVEDRKESPSEFDVAAFLTLLSTIAAGLSLLWPRNLVVDAEEAEVLPGDWGPKVLTFVAYAALGAGLLFALYGFIHSV